jgi:hypothetical protein
MQLHRQRVQSLQICSSARLPHPCLVAFAGSNPGMALRGQAAVYHNHASVPEAQEFGGKDLLSRKDSPHFCTMNDHVYLLELDLPVVSRRRGNRLAGDGPSLDALCAGACVCFEFDEVLLENEVHRGVNSICPEERGERSRRAQNDSFLKDVILWAANTGLVGVTAQGLPLLGQPHVIQIKD